MKAIQLIIIILCLWSSALSQNNEDVIIAKKIVLHSTVMDEERTIFVSTPSNYESTNVSYPVFYVLDGDEGSIHYTSGLVADLATRALCPEMIIVAIANTDRFRDMTPTVYDRNPNIPSGGADKFLKCIETEIISFIENNYRTLPYRLISGHSASGILVTHAFLSHTKLFNSYIGVSPSLWWDSNLFSKVLDENILKVDSKHRHFYFSIGSKETNHNLDGALEFYQTMLRKNPKQLQWKFDTIKGEDHGSQKTIALYNGLRFIYEDWKYDYQKVGEEGLPYITSFYESKSAKYGYEIKPSEEQMNNFGYALKRTGKLDEAIEIFKMNAENNPRSPNAHDSLAETYLEAGLVEQSINHYKQAIEYGSAINDLNLNIYKSGLEKAKEEQKKNENI
ncbi:MAG: hypothetical protein KKA84_05035 [Bacteroidetes bacterium]|nr:hypothetical protein [Bacteroidota bacterium]